MRNIERNLSFVKVPFAKSDNSEMCEYDFTDGKNFSENYKRYFGEQKIRKYEDINIHYNMCFQLIISSANPFSFLSR